VFDVAFACLGAVENNDHASTYVCLEREFGEHAELAVRLPLHPGTDTRHDGGRHQGGDAATVPLIQPNLISQH